MRTECLLIAQESSDVFLIRPEVDWLNDVLAGLPNMDRCPPEHTQGEINDLSVVEAWNISGVESAAIFPPEERFDVLQALPQLKIPVLFSIAVIHNPPFSSPVEKLLAVVT